MNTLSSALALTAVLALFAGPAQAARSIVMSIEQSNGNVVSLWRGTTNSANAYACITKPNGQTIGPRRFKRTTIAAVAKKYPGTQVATWPASKVNCPQYGS